MEQDYRKIDQIWQPEDTTAANLANAIFLAFALLVIAGIVIGMFI